MVLVKKFVGYIFNSKVVFSVFSELKQTNKKQLSLEHLFYAIIPRYLLMMGV